MPMDFFEHQDAARRKSTLLVVYFVLAVVLIMAAIYFVAAAAFLAAGNYEEVYELPDDWRQWWNLDLFVWVAGGTLAVILAGSAYRIATLSSGGEAVAEMLGARRVDPDTADPGERKLVNVVEEMALASGTPVPPVYVMEHEQAINAFAAGYSPGDAVVAVTRGALDYLTRDELQGVIAHEFSHVLHGDMRLNIRLIGILHGILLIALIGYVLVRSAAVSSRRSRRDGGAGGIVVLGAALVVIGYIGVFFGKLIKAAVSRQREYLADASAVQYTRNPDGIAGALKKIGGLSRGARIEAAHTEEASHMFFGNALRSWFSLLSTHPPLEDRIRRVDPSFDGRFPRVERVTEAEEAEEAARPSAARRPPARVFPGAMAGAVLEGAAGVIISPQEMVARIGEMEAGGLAFAAALLESLPDPLRRAVHSPFGARAVVYGMLLDRDEEVRRAQLERLAQHADPTVYQETQKLVPLVDRLHPSARVPLIELALPALRTLSPDQYRAFRENVDHLVKADKKIQLFEYVLQRMLIRHLEEQFRGKRPPAVQYYAVKAVLPESVGILSTLAHMGHEDPAEAARAFAAGVALLHAGEARLELKPRSECGLRVVDEALKKLAAASPQIKKRLLTAATACIAADGKVTVAEGELLRAIADSLDCPMPPLVAGQTAEPAAGP